MSIRIMNSVWQNEDVSQHRELIVLLALADFSDDDGVCFPSVPKIAKKSRMSERNAQRIIHVLCEKKWLEVLTEGGCRNGKNISNRYKILLGTEADPGRGDNLSPGVKMTPRGDRVVSPGGDKAMTPQGVTELCHPNHQKEPSKETSTTTERSPVQAEPAATEKEVVVASSFEGSSEQEAEMDAETLEDLGAEFGLNAKQADELRACAVRYGIGYVEEKAEITRAEPRKNAAAFFMKALTEDWQRPVKIARKVRNIPVPSKEEDAPSTPPDFSAELRWWQSATDEEKEAMLARPECELFRHKMRGNPSPSNLHLSAIRLALAKQGKSQPVEAAA